MAGKKNGSGAAWLEELESRPVLHHWFLRFCEQLAWPSGWGRASCEMGTRARGVLSQLVCAPTGALAERAASGAFPRSVVPKASIWAWGIPQNCHTVTVHVCKITHTWVLNGSSLAKELGLCNGVAELCLYFPFIFDHYFRLEGWMPLCELAKYFPSNVFQGCWQNPAFLDINHYACTALRWLKQVKLIFNRTFFFLRFLFYPGNVISIINSSACCFFKCITRSC